jgi:type II secretory pathway pseudopilin PulG
MVRRSEAGYTLLVLTVLIAVLAVGLLVALPVWETQVRREKEAELLFRGRQYMEAVRLYTLKNPGRFPKTLDELVEGRFLRRPFPDPMTKDGVWDLILQGGMPTITPPSTSRPSPQPAFPNPEAGGIGNPTAPTQQIMIVQAASLSAVDNPRIIGVVSSSTRTSFFIWEENETYDSWLFYHGRTPGKKPEIIRFGTPQK